MSNPKEVSCLKCGWVHFEYNRAEAKNAVRRFNEWYDSQRESVKMNYVPLKLQDTPSEEINFEDYHSKIENYESCVSCGGSYKNFRDTKPKELGGGHTLNPIIPREE